MAKVKNRVEKLRLKNFTDSGISNSDKITNDNAFTLSLSGNETNSTVTYQLSTDGGTTWSNTTANQSNLTDGNYKFRAVVTDKAGNSSLTDVVSVTVDKTAPTATITMSDSALKIGETATVTITFSEKVTGFDNSDVVAENGTLSEFISNDGGKTWSATFTPTSDIEDTTNVITLANTYTDLAGNSGTTAKSANYTIDTIAPIISFYSWNGLNGYDEVKDDFNQPPTIYLNYDNNFSNNAYYIEQNNSKVWMLVSDYSSTQTIDSWIQSIETYNSTGGNILGLSLDIEPWVHFDDQNNIDNKEAWTNYLNMISYTSQALHEKGLKLSVSIPFWLDTIDPQVFPNNRPLDYDIIDLADEIIIMDYTTNQSNFIANVEEELRYADEQEGKEIKLALECSPNLDPAISFYSDPESIATFLNTQIQHDSFNGYVIHPIDIYASFNLV